MDPVSRGTTTCPSCGGETAPGAVCERCHAPLPPRAQAAAAPGDGSPEPPHADDPDAPPGDADAEARAAFAEALFTTTPRLFVTPILVGANIAVFLAMLLAGVPILGGNTETLMGWGASYGPALTQGEWWRVVTSLFLHGGLIHLFANMFVLVSIGPLAERLFGHAAFAILYLLAGVAGSLAGIYWHPLGPSVGASGAVFGVMGAVLAYALRQWRHTHRSILTALARSVAGAIVLNILLGFTVPRIDMAAHLGGLAGGLVLGFVLARPLAPRPWTARLPLNAAVAMAGLALAVLVARQLPAYDDWLAAVTRVAALEARANGVLQKVLGPATEHQENAKAYQQVLSKDVLPPWSAARGEVARLRLPEPQKTTAAQLARYMDARSRQWQLLGKALGTGDARALKASRQAQADAEALSLRMRDDDGGPAPRVQIDTRAIDEVIALQDALGRVQKTEATVIAAFNDIGARLRRGALSPAAAAGRLDREVIAPWKAEYEMLRGVQLPDPLSATRDRTATYMQLRLEAWELMARGLRENSAALLAQAVKKQEEAVATMKQAAAAAPNAAAPPQGRAPRAAPATKP